MSNSATVVTSNLLGSGAVGKVMELFGAGQMGLNDGNGTPILHQDLAVKIIAVNGFNVTISSVAGCTSNHILCTFGTNNAAVFQHVVDIATNGDTILIPGGNYLLLPSQVLDPAFIMANYADIHPGFIVSKGGLTFQGSGTNFTILTACGAWQNKGATGTRGFIVWLQGPVTNDAPVVFDGITFDGGVKNGRTGYDYWPVRVADGDGWDVTHGAILDILPGPLQQLVTIQNCSFIHWRGEILKSVAPLTDGYRVITNCTFYDGNATANNFSFSHRIDHCTFDTLKGAQEFYQGYSTQPSYFQNSLITNMAGVTGGGIGIVIGGAEVGHAQPLYTISNNIISAAATGIFLDPVQNLRILNNTFCSNTIGVYFGAAGYQGSTNTGNVWIQGNTFSNVYGGICMYGDPTREAPHDIIVVSNFMQGPGGTSEFACGGGWSTNVVFTHNRATGVSFGLYGSSLSGQWFKDDTSNVFPFYSENDWVGRTNIITYANGMRHAPGPFASGCVFKLDDSSPWQIPPGAMITMTNAGDHSAILYTSTASITAPISMTNGYSAIFNWTNGGWRGGSIMQQISPPTNLRVILSGQ